MIRDGRLLCGRGVYGHPGRGEKRSVVTGEIDDLPLELIISDAQQGGVELRASREGYSTKAGTSLGRSWSASGAPPGARPIHEIVPAQLGVGYAIFPGHQDSASTVSIAGSPAHQVAFGPGGMITSWEVDGVEIVSMGGAYQRGFQQAATWTDGVTGEWVRHNPAQGGDLWSTSSDLRSAVITRKVIGPRSALHQVMPVEIDPGGARSIIGVRSWHGGSRHQPVWWRPLRFTTRWTFGYRNDSRMHLLECEWDVAQAVETAWFDVHAYLAMFLNDQVFPRVRCHDLASSTDTDLAFAGPGYEAEARRYVVAPGQMRGDDELAPSASPVPSGNGLVAALGATDNDLAVGVWLSIVDPSDDADGQRRTDQVDYGNSWTVLQKRDGTTGPAGSNIVCIAPGSHLTNRVHPAADRRVLSRFTRMRALVLTTSYADMIPLVRTTRFPWYGSSSSGRL